MTYNPQPLLIKQPLHIQDVVFTPRPIAKSIIEHFNPNGIILDPCKGDGAFYDQFPGGREYCEINEGIDFFAYQGSPNWIIGNPPYKICVQWIRHSLQIAPDIVYLIPTNKPFNGYKIQREIALWGGIKENYVIGSGSSILFNFPTGFCISAIHFQKGYKGGMKTTFHEDQQ